MWFFRAPQDFEKVKHIRVFLFLNEHSYMLMSSFALFFTFLQKYVVYFLESGIAGVLCPCLPPEVTACSLLLV